MLNGEEGVRVSRVGLRGKLLAVGEEEAGSWEIVHWAGRGLVMSRYRALGCSVLKQEDCTETSRVVTWEDVV
jgi:hypothetical protein